MLAFYVIIIAGIERKLKINVTERNIEVSKALRDYAVNKVRGLSKYFDGIISCDITLKIEKEREIAEIIAHLVKNKIVKASCESKDLYISIDAAVDKLKRQIKKYKERLQEKDLPSDVEIATIQETSTTTQKGIKLRQLRLNKPMTPREAVIMLESSNDDFLIFMDSKRNDISVVHQLDDGNFEVIEPVY